MKRSPCRALAAPLLPVFIAAALPALAEETHLGPVRITAPKIGVVEYVAGNLNAADLAALRPATSDTASLLRDIPGVSLYGAGGVSSLPAIHGLADDRLRIKVDGMDLVASCPNHMNSPLSYLDPSNIGVLKVWAGVAPVSVGGDSIGGTIVAETPMPEFAAPGQGVITKGQVGALYRSNSNTRGINASATIANESLSLTYSGATSRADNYSAAGNFKPATLPTGRVGHVLPMDEVASTAYKTENHTLGFAIRNANHLVEAKFGYQNIPYELYPNQRMDMLGNRQHRFNLRYAGQFDWGMLEARAYRETVRHHMDFGADKRFWYGVASGAGAPCAPLAGMGSATPTCAAGMPMDTESTNNGATMKATFDLTARDILRLGGEVQRYELNDWWPPSGGGMWPGTFWNIKEGQRDRTAAFAEWEARRDERWTTLLGIRYERVKSDAGNVQGYSTLAGATGNQVVDAAAFNARGHERADSNWDLTAIARHASSEALDIDFGYAHKTRSPNLYERYTWSTWSMAAVMNNFVGDGNGYIGNLDLKPEKANTFTATFDWHAPDRRWELKATPYYTRVSDYIDAVKSTTVFTAGRFNVLQYANQSARLYGIDLSGRLPLVRTGLGEFGLQGLLNYTNGKNRDTGDDLYNIMPLNAKLTFTHKQGGWSNGIEVVAVKAKDKLSDTRNEIKTPGYGLVNLRASYDWKQVRVDFGVENLFDRFYYLPLGGAYAGQGRTMALWSATDMPWGIPVPGMGRSFYTGLTVRF